MEKEVGGTVSEEKSIVMASDTEVAEKLVDGTGRRWNRASYTRNLGIDTSYCKKDESTQRSRIEQARARVGRFAFLRGFGGQVAAVVRGGPMASMVWGACAQGATEATLMRARSVVGACSFGPLGGASLTLNFLVSHVRELDPVYAMTLGPLKQWAAMVWSGTAETMRKTLLECWLRCISGMLRIKGGE